MEVPSYLDIVETNRVVTVIDPAITYSFPLDNFQNQAQFYIQKSENILVTAHTSAGKTVVAESGIMFAKKRGKRAFYTSPIKTLSNQKYSEFAKKFGNVGLLTGDIKCNPDAQCVVMTTEILRDMLFKNNTDALNNLDCVIFDEVHYINNIERGHVWEECIIKLPPEVTLIMLSATISDADKFANWIGHLKKKPIHLISTPRRPIPLNHYIYINNQQHLLYDSDGHFHTDNYALFEQNYRQLTANPKFQPINLLNPFVKYLMTQKLNPTIFFIFSRKKCEKYANHITVSLVNQKEKQHINSEFNEYLTKHSMGQDLLEQLPQVQQVKKILLKGIGLHHSGLLPVLKEIVEIFFSKGYLKILFATETFAVGVNTPTRTVVFTELKKYSDKDDVGPRFLNPDEYLQMSGRAGRRGLDQYGIVLLLFLKTSYPVDNVKKLLTGKSASIISKFKINQQYTLQLLSSNRQIGQEIASESSYLSCQHNEAIIKLEQDKDLLIRGKALLESQFGGAHLNQSHIRNLTQLFKLEEQLKNLGDLKSHEAKMLQKDIRQLKDQVYYIINGPNLAKIKPLMKDITDINDVIEKITKDIDHLKKQISQQFDDCRRELYAMGYLLSVNGLQYENLTMKGRIAVHINNAHPILLTELLTQRKFHGLDNPSIAAVLSLFCGESDSSVVVETSRPYHPLITWVYDLTEQYQKKYPSFAESLRETRLSTNSTYLAYLWAKGVSYLEILPYLETYDGNFVRNILKISLICDEIINICEICQDALLEKKIIDLKTTLVRDIVTFDSLYLK